MKRLMSMLFVSILTVFVVTACGGQQSTQTSSQPSAQTTSKESDQGQANEESNEGSKEVFTLKLAEHFPVTHLHGQGSVEFMKRVEELSDGRIKFEHYPAQQLGSVKDMLPLVQQGTADITLVSVPSFAGQLPLNTVMMLPNFTTSAEQMEIYKRMIEEVPELTAEYEKYGTVPIANTMMGQYTLGTKNKTVHTPEDVKGLRLASGGGVVDMIAERYGISVVGVGGPDRYEAIQKGIIDGNIAYLPSVEGYKLYEQEKHHTLGIRMGAALQVYLMNKNSWDKLPKDLQDILLQEGKNLSERNAVAWDENTISLKEEFEKEHGMTIYTVTPEEYEAKWAPPLEGLGEQWADSMESKGLPGKKVYDAFIRISQEVIK